MTLPTSTTCSHPSDRRPPPPIVAPHTVPAAAAAAPALWICHGRSTAKATADGLPVLNKEGDICQNATIPLPLGEGTIWLRGLDCPTPVGNLSIVETAFINHPPPGIYAITLDVTDATGPLLCVKVEFQF